MLFKPYEKFNSKLLEEIMDSSCWADFLPQHLSESEKSMALSTLLRSGVVESESIVSIDKASIWLDKANKMIESILNLSRHCSRTVSKPLKKWIKFCEKTISAFKASPSKRLFEIMERQSFHSKTMLECVTRGKAVDSLAREIYQMVSSSVKTRDIRIMESLVDHSKFIQALEKNFDIKVKKYEPIRDGVFVYLDDPNTAKLSDVVSNSTSYITKIADELGYLLLRKGTPSDIQYGNFGEDASCWMFVYAPVTKEEKEDNEGEVVIKQKFKNLKLSERWG